jgi:hypothetical protein
MSNALATIDPSTDMTPARQALWRSLLSSGRTIRETIQAGEITKADLPALRAEINLEEVRTRPVSVEGMMGLLEALFQHYYAPALSESAQAQRWKDWHADVGHLPGPVLAEACAKWRRSAAKHAPSPGQLLALANKDYRVRLLAAQRAADILEKD